MLRLACKKIKEVFTMTKKKKIIIAVVCAVLVVVGIGAGSIAYASDVVKKNSIGIDKAIQSAMVDAGVTEENTIIRKAKMSFDNGTFVYDVEFVSGGYEYDYVLKASDGTIMEKDRDVDDGASGGAAVKTPAVSTTAAPAAEVTTLPAAGNDSADDNNSGADAKTSAPKAETTTAKKSSGSSSSSNISLSQAKSAALKAANVSSSSATFTKAYLDYDDGVKYYEIEFYTSSYEYEYEIAMDGSVKSYDREARTTKKKTTTTKQSASAKYIGIDKAKSAALSNAGKSSSQVTFTKAKLEKDDGIWQYEIEFISGNYEYEYEINAENGKIISHDKERVDYDD